METEPGHESVLLEEALRLLVTDRDGTYLDATVGAGGHSEGILRRISAQGNLVGTDMDPEALQAAEVRLRPFAGRFRLVHANFRTLSQVLTAAQSGKLAGALFDLGVSSLQLDKASRGFSLLREGPLDMRLDPGSPLTAGRIVNEWPAEQLELLFREYGEERQAGLIARLIVERRAKQPLSTTLELANLISARLRRTGRIHPATRTFMALRIAVNQELENLTRGLEAVVSFLRPGGRLAVISFHSLEDRIVKNVFKSFVDHGWCIPVTQSPVCPGPEEMDRNPRARSAKLRSVEKRP
ncbi:MAG: 16S rRNA (cytosine(1402)-N(4))-methyltransferase RsmH [Elusimicrobiota bacterium]